MRNLQLIIKREYLSRIRNKTFVVMTFLSPVIMVAMVMLIAYLTSLNNDEEKIVGVHDVSNIVYDQLQEQENTVYLNLSYLDLRTAIDSVDKKEYYGLLYIPSGETDAELSSHVEFFAKEAPSNFFLSDLEQKISGVLSNRKLENTGVNLATIENSKAQVNIKIENFSGQTTSKMASYVKMFFGGAAGYLLMMFIIIYGNMVMRSVIEEKTNRIVEIIISSVKPIQLMLGKIVGTSLAGITQFFIWIIFGSILLFSVTAIFGIESTSIQGQAAATAINQDEMQLFINDVLQLPLGTITVAFLIYFIGGYFLYSSIYAAIGAAVDSETDTQQFMFPVILPLMLGIYVGFFSVIENPHGIVATIFSYIPLTSPIVMLMRIPFGVAWWEVLISLSILFATVFLVIWMAAKIYRVGILMYGKKASYKELFKWLKY
ncbi:ABC transporter permease [Mesonia sp. MT50]|uniref:ABC transporter permease n=1 Tax=Mesonia profundi TaxID=3070998 RepID=A0ABU1A047_9FLAO|nr:ABC transporter permease [Mesonia profundi]MDQ7917077.1 ABC transporter permease [Mesonia profundi]